MQRIFLPLLFVFAIANAQENRLKKVEIFAGLSSNGLVGLKNEISFQMGKLAEVGGKYNFYLGQLNYISSTLNFSYSVFDVEGYFINQNQKDNFITTPSDVKVNSLIFSPTSLGLGYQKVLKKNIVGIDIRGVYSPSLKRKYKIGNNELEEKYYFNKKLNIGLEAVIGFLFPSNNNFHLDLFLGYLLTSMASNTQVTPLNAGLRLTQGLGK